MSANKFTPGPWTVADPEDLSYTQVIVAASGTDDAEDVAEVSISRPDIHPNARANARLIAAAPELLDLLQKHLDWFEGKFLPVNESEFIAATRAAIAKARGE